MKPLDPDMLQTVMQRLVAEFRPEQVWLFGSHVWGAPSEASDLDRFVIVPSSEERPIYHCHPNKQHKHANEKAHP